jgi:hypothetical protein
MLDSHRPERRAESRRWRSSLTDIRRQTRQGLSVLLWLVAAAAIALGAAGVVAGMDTPLTGGGDRTGRSAQGDATVTAAMTPIEAELRGLADAVDQLGTQGRTILASLSANDPDAIDTATATGTQLVTDIDARVARITDALAGVPIVDTPGAAYELSPETRDRYAAYVGGLKSTEAIKDAWTRLTVGSLSASRMSQLLAAHDAAVVAAAKSGRDADYKAALSHLDDADAAIKDATAVRDKLAATVDVSTLDEWLERSHAYDVALRKLYVAVQRADGRVTPAVKQAAAAEAKAKDRLPPDTRSLVLIMSDIGRGGINDSAIAIEQASDDLREALAPPVEEAPAPAIDAPVPAESAAPS